MAATSGLSGFGTDYSLSEEDLARYFFPELYGSMFPSSSSTSATGTGATTGSMTQSTPSSDTSQAYWQQMSQGGQTNINPLWAGAVSRKQDFWTNRAPRMMHYLRDSAQALDEAYDGGKMKQDFGEYAYYPSLVDYNPDAVDYGYGMRQFTPETVTQSNADTLAMQRMISPLTTPAQDKYK